MEIGFLSDKIGPLPTWGWISIGVLGLYVFSKKHATTPSVVPVDPGVTATLNKTPPVVLIQEGYPVYPTPQSPTYTGTNPSAYTGVDYQVKQGDTLAGIIAKYYRETTPLGNAIAAKSIAEANGLQWNSTIKNYDLTPGMTLKLQSDALLGYQDSTFVGDGRATPATLATPFATAKARPAASPSSASRTVVVGASPWANDLASIAQHTYGSSAEYMRIAQANNLANPNAIQPGQQLVLP